MSDPNARLKIAWASLKNSATAAGSRSIATPKRELGSWTHTCSSSAGAMSGSEWIADTSEVKAVDRVGSRRRPRAWGSLLHHFRRPTISISNQPSSYTSSFVAEGAIPPEECLSYFRIEIARTCENAGAKRGGRPYQDQRDLLFLDQAAPP